MQSSSSFLTCQRCQRSLQLDDSLSDEALASAASSSSNEGLTHSHYDVISSIVAKNAAVVGGKPRRDVPTAAPANVRDPQLRAAILEQTQQQSSSSSTLPPAATNSLSAGLALHTQLFDLVSSLVPSRPDSATPAPDALPKELALGIDHPLCLKCSDYCLEVVRKQIEEVRRERDALKEFNHELAKKSDREEEEEVKRMEAEIADLQTVMQNAVASLRESESVRTGLEAELKQLELEEQQLESEEAEFWASHSALLAETNSLESVKASLLRSIHVSEATLSRLNATNVFFDAFCIGHEGASPSSSSSSSSSGRHRSSGAGLATINGLRFGRISSLPSSSGRSTATVPWNEVNAAWGQVALLIEVLRVKIGGILDGEQLRSTAEPGARRGREFAGWRIYPKGSTSYLVKMTREADGGGGGSAEGSESQSDPHELYYPDPYYPFSGTVHLRRFDSAMRGILECTRQLFEWAERATASATATATAGSAATPATARGEAPRIVHAINGEKIGDIGIRLGGKLVTPEGEWSRALKYLLVNLQVLMHWATKDETVPVPAPDESRTQTQQAR